MSEGYEPIPFAISDVKTPTISGANIAYGGYWEIGKIVVVNLRVILTSTHCEITFPKPSGTFSSPGVPISGYGGGTTFSGVGIQVSNGSVMFDGTADTVYLLHATYIKE